MPSSRFSTPRRTLLAALSAAVLAFPLAACGKSEASLQDVHGIDLSGASFGDGFRLKDPDGRVRTLEDFKGKVVMMFFGFTQCPDVCPTALVNASQIKSLLGKDGDDLQVLFITVDPERDTPEVLAEYLGNFDPRITGLTGDPEQIRAAAEDFRVRYEKIPREDADYTMNHTAGVFLFHPEGRFASIIDFHEDRRHAVPKIRRALS